MRTFAILAGILLIVVGGFSLLGGGFSWTEEETVMDMGPVQATAETRESFALPPLAAGGALALGIGLGAWGLARKEE